MSANLTDLWTIQFSTNLELKLQQMGSKLRSLVRSGTHTGARMASPVQEIGNVTLRRPAGRFTPMPRQDAAFTRRWVFPIDGELPQLIDSFDELKTMIDPKSQYVENAANAVGRGYDDEVIAAFVRTSYIGRDASELTTESFDTSAFRIAVDHGASAATGLTVEKLLEARRVFRHYEVDIDNEPLTLVIGSLQEKELLSQTEVVSQEFNDKPVLQDGKLQRFLGFNIVCSERLPTYTTTTRGVIAFAKSGMYLGMWKDMSNRVSIRNDLSGEPWQLYTSVAFGATRLQPGKVLQIACADATGAAIVDPPLA